MTEKELNSLANKIVAKMMHLKTMEQWFEHVRDSDLAKDADFFSLHVSEEYEAMGDLAKLVTLLNLYISQCWHTLSAINQLTTTNLFTCSLNLTACVALYNATTA